MHLIPETHMRMCLCKSRVRSKRKVTWQILWNLKNIDKRVKTMFGEAVLKGFQVYEETQAWDSRNLRTPPVSTAMGQPKWPEPKSKVLKATRKNNSAFMRNFRQRKGKFFTTTMWTRRNWRKAGGRQHKQHFWWKKTSKQIIYPKSCTPKICLSKWKQKNTLTITKSCLKALFCKNTKCTISLDLHF